MKIKVLDLEFNSEYFYIQRKSIVEKIIFNNRTFYSKFEKFSTPLTPILLEQHYNNEITLALPLIENDTVNYLVIEYHQDDWKSFYALIKHLFKTLDIDEYFSYRNHKKELQIFIPCANISLETAYKKVENIKLILEFKSKKSYKIFPNSNLPKNYNIITLPSEKL
ncbi:DUF1882 domain-containing protein [bacterium]|nr:DUF1882 domain-containing protein [bacterium]MBU1958832.1 DUF1882 domain-containing protein [bacterium]